MHRYCESSNSLMKLVATINSTTKALFISQMINATSIVTTITLIISIFAINSTMPTSWGVDMQGTQGADTMQGTATDDDIRGYNGDDIINDCKVVIK